ncbi:MAG: MFS transporter [Sphingobacteriaceae bacterium]|nr:MAG: MFS transporter [Sphingobacteriaceae bacterium]
MTATPSIVKKNVVFLVIVAALGYFVDIYDLVIFSIVRVKSLQDIGVPADMIENEGNYVINMQMFGLLLGGIIWGVMGDKLGRIKVLFGSIFLYSAANIINGLVKDVDSYAIVRFVAGIGLAGELGAGITLVSETLSKERRGYGTTIVAVIGLLGAVAAGVAGQFDWKIAYFIGGGLGILLLLLRVGTFESGMFKNISDKDVSKGNILMLFNDRKRFLKYLYCILIGAPLWYVVGVLVTKAPEFGVALGSTEPLSAGTGIMYTYVGISVGGVFAGLLAQYTRSRKNTMFIFLLLSVISTMFYLSAKGITPGQFIWLCFFMGFGVGYWATFVTIASEQFGTNIRSTVTTTVPNFVRGSLIPINYIFTLLMGHFGRINAGYIVMVVLTGISLFATSQLQETFDKDLDYIEDEGANMMS